MAYQAPSISASGLTIPSYTDILSDFIAQYQIIYGQTSYLGVDSADYQFLSAISLKVSDVMQAVQLAYMARSPGTAIGADLDGIVKLNGLVRKPASFGTVDLTVIGTAGTTINSGVAQDANGIKWDLPGQVIIPGNGSVVVTATCENPGRYTANPGDVSIVYTPTAGWLSVTNVNAAIAGQPTETDSQLRARQALSVALPSNTRLEGTIAGIAKVSGVTRYRVIENPTGQVDQYGTPAHSITCVVEGATDAAVAQAIYANRGIGALANGTTTVQVTDPTLAFTMPISFDRPTYVPIYVTITVQGLTGYTTATTAAIQTSIVNYLNSLQIGETVVWSEVIGAALQARTNPDLPLFSIRSLNIGVTMNTMGTADLGLAYFQVAQGNPAIVIVATQ